MGAKKKSEGIDINNWKEVADFAKSAGVSAKELYNYTINKKGFKNKTDTETMMIGCLIYDTLKKKSKLKPRSRILNLRKNIELINPKYKQYSRAKIDFATAQLRRETGAVINASEIDWIDLTYFPLFGDDEKTLQQKSDARKAAYIAMKTNAGKAYDVAIKSLKDYEEQGDATPNITPELATQELIERAKTDPELRIILKQRGIL